MLHRWNLSIILIITAFVFGGMCGYIYRDRFSWLLPNFAHLDRTQADIGGDIARTSIEDILRPDSGIAATTGQAEVYSFTGGILAVNSESITVNQPTDETETIDAIDFILTPETVYVSAQAIADENGLPGLAETTIDQSALTTGDLVTVYTREDIRSANERHVTKVQQFID